MKFYSLISILLISGCTYSQQKERLINEIDEKLTRGQVSISNVLSNPQYMFLHSQIPFREIIKKHATTGKVRIITEAEPGKKITVKGVIQRHDAKPLSDALLYFYHTSDKGWYSDTAAHISGYEGDPQHARLFGYLKTDSKGQFEFETIQPKGYPNSDLPAHIHIMLWKDGRVVNRIPGELLFDDDPRLTADRRSRSLNEGFLIEKNSGSLQQPVYFYRIVVGE
jgi:protocatechuate 3,4-dioxygenase beta subunit